MRTFRREERGEGKYIVEGAGAERRMENEWTGIEERAGMDDRAGVKEEQDIS